jgi:hypothetical protein
VVDTSPDLNGQYVCRFYAPKVFTDVEKKDEKTKEDNKSYSEMFKEMKRTAIEMEQSVICFAT